MWQRRCFTGLSASTNPANKTELLRSARCHRCAHLSFTPFIARSSALLQQDVLRKESEQQRLLWCGSVRWRRATVSLGLERAEAGEEAKLGWRKQPCLISERGATNSQSPGENAHCGKQVAKKQNPAVLCVPAVSVYLNCEIIFWEGYFR